MAAVESIPVPVPGRPDRPQLLTNPRLERVRRRTPGRRSYPGAAAHANAERTVFRAAILIFVGIKMSISHWYHINTYVSLAIIIAMLAAAIVFSIRRANEIEAAALVSDIEGV